MAESGFLHHPLPLAFAHRGFAPDGGENSMVAFERAVRLGYRYLETDVRVTADGVALAFHDARLDRVTDGRGRIDRLPWTRVRQARIGGVEPIPTLAEVLSTWPDVRVNLDVKADSGVGPTVETIRRTDALDRVCVAAFADHRIAAVRRALGPDLCTSLGPRAALALRLGRVPPGRFVGRCAQVPERAGVVPVVDRRFLTAARRAGAQVHVWTVNDPRQMRRLLELGVEGIITDRADTLRDLLVERGQWTVPPSGPEAGTGSG